MLKLHFSLFFQKPASFLIPNSGYLKILSLLPSETGLVFIIIHHQPSDWKSFLPEIIPRYTKMPVKLVEDGEVAKANHVYVSPPGMQVYMSGDKFGLSPLLK